MPRSIKPRYPTLKDVLDLHELVMRIRGYEPQPLRANGIGQIEGACTRPKNIAFYEAASINRQAALLCLSISQAQAFLDGNKRTAVAVTDFFLKSVGKRLAPGSTILADKLFEIADRLIIDHSQANEDILLDELETLFDQIVIPN